MGGGGRGGRGRGAPDAERDQQGAAPRPEQGAAGPERGRFGGRAGGGWAKKNTQSYPIRELYLYLIYDDTSIHELSDKSNNTIPRSLTG